MTKVAIFGCGPSGLVAAQAALNAGVGRENIFVYSVKKKSAIFGAQYLHAEIPGVDAGDPVSIAVKFLGTAEGYRAKVYGENYQGIVSPQEFRTDHHAWDIRRAYDILWDRFASNILHFQLDPMGLSQVYPDIQDFFDVIINTVPRRVICKNPEHQFKSQNVYAIGDAPERGIKCPVHCERDTLVYNGSPDYAWYRISNIFGFSTAEWPASEDRAKPPISGLASVTKPLSTDCDCWPRLTHLGRFGAWQKGVLVHHVYEEAHKVISKAANEGVQGELF